MYLIDGEPVQAEVMDLPTPTHFPPAFPFPLLAGAELYVNEPDVRWAWLGGGVVNFLRASDTAGRVYDWATLYPGEGPGGDGTGELQLCGGLVTIGADGACTLAEGMTQADVLAWLTPAAQATYAALRR